MQNFRVQFTINKTYEIRASDGCSKLKIYLTLCVDSQQNEEIRRKTRSVWFEAVNLSHVKTNKFLEFVHAPCKATDDPENAKS